MKRGMSLKRFTAAVLIASIVTAIFPEIAGDESVIADAIKNQSNTCLGTSGIASPVAPSDEDDPWSGSYVYFGTYGDNPIKFRVLAPQTSVYGGTTMFLDSDEVLFERGHSPDLNGSFLTDSFTLLESDAIALSSGDGGYPEDPDLPYVMEYPEIVNSKIFVLEAFEVGNPVYGYSSAGSRVKMLGDVAYGWMLRSRELHAPRTYIECIYVLDNGEVEMNLGWINGEIGYAPALNVDLSSVIFSSLITGSFNTVGTEYKLTVSDPNLDIAIQAGRQATIAGSTVTIPYCISGTDAANATRASVLVTTGEYNAEGSQILYYDSLGSGSTGIGTFTLPSELTLNGWGSDYNVYILAEDINGTYETDYASVPVKVDAPISGATMYRLYNPNSGEHFYTASAGERNHIISLGWNDEGIGWYSDDARTVPLYRQYNPNAFANNHNYTTSLSENNWLVSIGWQAEGIGWYGVGT
ncbi:MAG: hypothetical protein IKN80_00530 [Clostridiales bacterium]|nr:hypothetical protein [Clostridiales bacterium]